MKELEKTTDPQQWAAIEKQLADLNRKRADVKAKYDKLYEIYKAADC